MTKACKTCRETKDASEFSAHSGHSTGLQPRCRDCIRKYDRDRWNNNPAVRKWAKNYQLTKKYGIDLELFEFILQEQGNCCRICKRKESEVPFNNGQPWQVDHNHSTNKFRGIICTECNLGLGKFKDNAATLISAATYLSL